MFSSGQGPSQFVFGTVQRQQPRCRFCRHSFTDMAYTRPMFRTTFRILETLDEHFYAWDPELQTTTAAFAYHWPLHGLGLPDDVLRKVEGDSARRVFRMARENAV